MNRPHPRAKLTTTPKFLQTPADMDPPAVPSQDLRRPSAEEVSETKERTEKAMKSLLNNTSTRKPSIAEPTYVSYTTTQRLASSNKQCVVKITSREADPTEPPKFKQKRIPRNVSPARPILHSPPRVTATDADADWAIPPVRSAWKNNRGYSIPLDRRVIDTEPREVRVEGVARLSEVLRTAEQVLREEVNVRAGLESRLKAKEDMEREERLRQLAFEMRERYKE